MTRQGDDKTHLGSMEINGEHLESNQHNGEGNSKEPNKGIRKHKTWDNNKLHFRHFTNSNEIATNDSKMSLHSDEKGSYSAKI